TVTGNAFSVGLATFVVTGGKSGFGTITPGVRLHAYHPTFGDSGYTGTTQTGAVGRWEVNGYAMDVGIASTSPNAFWMQVVNITNLTDRLPIDLNPRGGAVTVAGHAITTAFNVTGAITQSDTLSCTLGLKSDAAGTITGCVTSDRALKKNIVDMPYSNSVIDRLRPRTFDYKRPDRDGGGHHAGFVAQEVLSILPSAVVPAGNKLLGVDSLAITAALVKEVQELRKRVSALEAKP
ncbi:MAG: tail fiber domain-containing protein, partial [Patescibacteria group bacterium]